MKELKFNNPVFHSGVNVTVRRGLKWIFEDCAIVSDQNAALNHQPFKFSDLKNFPEFLLKEHDPECRTYEGLLKIMKETYNNFDENEAVTVVWFTINTEHDK